MPNSLVLMLTVSMAVMLMISRIRLKGQFTGSCLIEHCKVFGWLFVELFHARLAAEANFATLVLDAYVATHCIEGLAGDKTSG